MSLDISILGENGSPKKQVSVGVDDHYRLMQVIGQKTNSLLARMRDYYEDAEFETTELESLIGEATDLRAQCREDERLRSFLTAFIELAETAKMEQKPLIVIAD